MTGLALGRSGVGLAGGRRCLYTTPHDMKIEYLRQSLAEYHKPDQLAALVAKCPQIAQFRRSAVLVPISVRLVKNDKGNRVQKSFYTLSKRAQHLKSFKGNQSKHRCTPTSPQLECSELTF